MKHYRLMHLQHEQQFYVNNYDDTLELGLNLSVKIPISAYSSTTHSSIVAQHSDDMFIRCDVLSLKLTDKAYIVMELQYRCFGCILALVIVHLR